MCLCARDPKKKKTALTPQHAYREIAGSVVEYTRR